MNYIYIVYIGISGGNWIEIAYGTESGVVRIIVQHPETVYAAGHGPQLFQTFTVHRSPVIKVMLSEKHLISGISDNIRTFQSHVTIVHKLAGFQGG